MWSIIVDNLGTLFPLIVLSLISVSIIIERGIYFFLVREDVNLMRRAGTLYTQGKNDIALDSLMNSASPESALLRYAINNRFILDDLLNVRLHVIARNRLALLEQRIAFLAISANIATLLGLLGTVLGMIAVFSAMEQARASDPYILAGGIGQALLTTATGLMVAIPSLFFHHIFTESIVRRAGRLESLISEILSTKGASL
ncbi:MAG: MotA/TolQ/ExbB proton channel family protein [Spirochaetia bacterium]